MDNDSNLIPIIQISCIAIMACKIYLKSKEHFRRWWVKPHLTQELRSKFGIYTTLFLYFKLNDNEEFYRFTRMSVDQFDKLFQMIEPHLTTENPSGIGRPASPAEFKCAAVINYLANGDSVRQSAWVNNVQNNPSKWEMIAKNFYYHWDIPNCIGAIDGKHVRIKAPPNSGSYFFNYKKHTSFVLMAACDAFHRFIWLNLGNYGHQNDAGIFNNSDLGRGLEANAFPLPEPKNLPGTTTKLPYFFVRDGGFGLRSYLITPFTRLGNMNFMEKVFNYRLTRARCIIECAFGILAQKWRVFEFAMDFQIETTESIVLALMCIHNYLITSELHLPPENRRYTLEEEIEEEEDELNDFEDPDGVYIRNILAEYFVSAAGSIDAQWWKI